MNDQEISDSVVIDGTEYKISELSEVARAQIKNIQFVDEKLLQLNNEWAVADTARLAYTNALKNDMSNT